MCSTKTNLKRECKEKVLKAELLSWEQWWKGKIRSENECNINI